MYPEIAAVLLRFSMLLGGATLFVIASGAWLGFWAGAAALGLVLFLFALVSR